MTRTSIKFAARAVVAGVAVSALSLLAASPASAHTNNLYTYVGYDDPSGFATISRTTGDATVLPNSAQNYDEIIGAEVFNEVGTAIGVDYGDPYVFTVLNWNHTTGAEDAPVTAYVSGALEGTLYVSGLDTLANGTTITYVEYEAYIGGGEFPDFVTAIATVNKTTGELTPVIDMTSFANADYYVDSLATDPISGVTYAFLYFDEDDVSYFSALDFGAGSASEPEAFTGSGFDGDGGELLGADFDHDGTLFFIYANNSEEEYELSSVGGPSTWTTAARHFIGVAGGNVNSVSTLALTVEYTALAATGSSFPAVWLVAGTVAVLGGAITVVSATSRKKRLTA